VYGAQIVHGTRIRAFSSPHLPTAQSLAIHCLTKVLIHRQHILFTERGWGEAVLCQPFWSSCSAASLRHRNVTPRSPRRFAVTPLTEACGLIEWVNHTVGLRNCCQSVYRAAGKFDRNTNGIVKSKYDNFKVHPFPLSKPYHALHAPMNGKIEPSVLQGLLCAWQPMWWGKHVVRASM